MQARDRIEADPSLWAYSTLRKHMLHPVTREPVPWSPYQRELWDFGWRIEPGQLPVVRGRRRSTFVAVWSRSFAKTTNAQMLVAGLAARRRRRYGIIVSATKDKADEKVQGVGAMLTSVDFRRFYPEVGARQVREYGQGTWRRDRIQTLSGFNLDGYGLESYMRGAKIDDEEDSLRPDLIILDDIDEEHDSAYETQRKVETITKGILPAGDPGNTIVIVLQNLIIAGGVVDQLVNDADWLTDRIVSGPHPAVRDLRLTSDVDTSTGRTRWYIGGGTSTWPAGRSIPDLQSELDKVGPEAFKTEYQHDLKAASPLVYPQFRPDRHRWVRAQILPDADGVPTSRPMLPPFKGFAGGLDWAGEGETAHLSAGAVVGLTFDGRYILLDEWADNGPKVGQRQMDWMRDMGVKWGHIRWRGDGSQGRAADWGVELGFDMAAGDRDLPAAEVRREILGGLLIPFGVDARTPPEEWPASSMPGFSYLPRCVKFQGEMLRYRRKLPRSEEEPSRREVLKVHDDVIDAVLQALEEATRGSWRSEEEMVAYDGVKM